MPPVIYKFAGYTYDPVHDYGRLKVQLQRVFAHMLDGEWHTTPVLREAYGSAADSRIRDFRKAWCGSMHVVTERVEKGLFHHRLDLDSVDPAWARAILEGRVVNPRRRYTVVGKSTHPVRILLPGKPEVRVDSEIFSHLIGTLATLDAMGALDKMGVRYSAERKELFEALL